MLSYVSRYSGASHSSRRPSAVNHQTQAVHVTAPGYTPSNAPSRALSTSTVTRYYYGDQCGQPYRGDSGYQSPPQPATSRGLSHSQLSSSSSRRPSHTQVQVYNPAPANISRRGPESTASRYAERGPPDSYPEPSRPSHSQLGASSSRRGSQTPMPMPPPADMNRRGPESTASRRPEKTHRPPPVSYREVQSSGQERRGSVSQSGRSAASSVSSRRYAEADNHSMLSSSTLRPQDSASNVTSNRDFPRSETGSRASQRRGSEVAIAMVPVRGSSNISRAPSTSSSQRSGSRAPSSRMSSRTADSDGLPSLSSLGISLGSSSGSGSARLRMTETTTVTRTREIEMEVGSSSRGGSRSRFQNTFPPLPPDCYDLDIGDEYEVELLFADSDRRRRR